MTIEGLPKVDSDAVDSIFSLLSAMEMELDADPLQYGPKRLNGKVAKARRMLTECEGIFLKVSHWLQKYRSAHRTLDVELDLEKKYLYANDPEVRAGRNVADREALATIKLKEKAVALSQVAQTQSELEAVLTVIKAKRADLKDVQGRIRDQMTLCQEEIGLGGRWGAKPPPGTTAPDLDASPSVEKKTLKDLHQMFTGSYVTEPDLAQAAPPVEPSTPEPVDDTTESGEGAVPESEVDSLETSGTDADVDSYLDSIESPTPPPKQDLESLLDDLGI